MDFSTGGAVSDGYNIWSNGTGTFQHDFDAGDITLTVYARGEIAGGSGPNMVVYVGSTIVGDLIIDDETMQPYTFAYSGSGGVETVTIEFVNDYYQPPDDRNLIIGGATVDCGFSVAACGNGIVEAGEACDDGNADNTDACLDTCAAASCGDGYVWDGVEECDDGNANNDDSCLNSCVFPTGSGPFVEQNGLVVMEAEHYATLFSDVTTGDTWSELSVAAASGAMCMQVGPDSGNYHTQKADVEANAARMDYEVQFATTGTWYIWVRGASTTSQGWASDSCHGGIEGVAEALYLDYGSSGTFEWVRGTITVTWAGLHTVNVFMREDGFIADKILLTTNPGYTPSGINQPESPRL
jgi:cysteine-rich repeat protein